MNTTTLIILAIPIVTGFLVLFFPIKKENFRPKPIVKFEKQIKPEEAIFDIYKPQIISPDIPRVKNAERNIPQDPLPNYRLVLGSTSVVAGVAGTFTGNNNVSAIPLTEVQSTPRYNRDGNSHYVEIKFINDNLTN